jgi:glycerol uptake facilitator-like aquaporin
MKRYWHEVACKVLYNRREANTPNTKGNRHMRKQLASPWMRIALTLLLAGVIVQFTDFFEFFGHNSVIPLLIGLVIIVIGVSTELILRRYNKGKRM